MKERIFQFTRLGPVFTLVLVIIGGAYFWFTAPRIIIENGIIQKLRSVVEGDKQKQMNVGSEILEVGNGKDGKSEQVEVVSGIKENGEGRGGINVIEPGNAVLLANPNHTYQTFNNCGPATMSMILSYYGISVSQTELRDKMRPFNNPKGDNDDKTIFTSEFVYWAGEYREEAVNRVNGDIETLKRFTANRFPVVVKTWLHPNEDIGHFRIVRGFDESEKVIIQDDSYEGPNKRISYETFLSLWQPFNYTYIVVYPKGKEKLVETLLGQEKDENIAWNNALDRAKRESQDNPNDVYPYFNMSTAYYHLGDYKNSVAAFEKVENRLPARMLWYQIEPILSYKKLGNYERVFQIADHILTNHNRAFSELYLIKGDIYKAQGNNAEARKMYEAALYYNKNYKDAENALNNL